MTNFSGRGRDRSRLIWLTDIHLDRLPDGGAGRFGHEVHEAHWDANLILVTGDVAEAGSFKPLLEEFASGAGIPVRFVLGNHDFSGSSIREVRARAASMTDQARWLVSHGSEWLDHQGGTLLLGHDGWYDAREGRLSSRSIVDPDFSTILDFAGKSPTAFQAAARSVADRFVQETREMFTSVLDGHDSSTRGVRRIVFATHVPPYPQAAWHMDKPSDDFWLPWMCSQAMGDLLDDVSSRHPAVEFTVLCGHTHSPGEYQRSKNLLILTGQAEYGAPRVSGTFTFERETMTMNLAPSQWAPSQTTSKS
jgi:predicted phosphodiesterase